MAVTFREELQASIVECPGRAPVSWWRGPAGERPPYTALVIGAAMLGVYAFSHAPGPSPAAEILRDGPAPRAAWTKPAAAELLAGRACIPLDRLLENRPIAGEHSYSREVMCRKTQG